jgi:hypothetical protein
MMFRRSLIGIIGCAALLLTLPGCGGVLERFDRAIAEVQRTREAFVLQSADLQRFLKEQQEKAAKDLHDVLQKDVADVIKMSIVEGGKEARCDIDYVNEIALTYLKGVETALVRARDKIRREGNPDDLTPESVVATVKAEQKRIPPRVYHTLLTDPVTFKSAISAGTPPYTPAAKGKVLSLAGYGLMRHAGEKASYALSLVGADGNRRPLSGPLLAEVDQGQASINLEEVARQVRPGDRMLEVRWGELLVSQVPIHIEAPVPRTRNVYVRVLGIDIYNKGHGKDTWSMKFLLGLMGGYTPQEWSCDRITDDAQKGNPQSGEVGPDGKDCDFTRYDIDKTLGPVRLVSPGVKIGLMVVDCEATLSAGRHQKLTRDLARCQRDPVMRYRVDDLKRQLTPEQIPWQHRVFSAEENYGIGNWLHVYANAPAHRIVLDGRPFGSDMAAYVYFSVHEANE